MGKKSGPSAPPPPDPVKVAQAQSEANIATAREQQRLNMIGTAGPQGTVQYEADPNSPGGYRQVTALSKPEQAIYDASKGVELGAVNIAGDQLGRVRTALETPLDTSGLANLRGEYGVAPLTMNLADSGGIRSSFDTGPALRYGFDTGQQVQGSVGGNQDLARMMASEANYRQMTSRLDPRFAQDERRLDQKLANQGFSMNSAGTAAARDQFARDKNDAYDQAGLSAIREGEAAAQGQFGRELSQGQFANQAAAQQYGQGLGSADFYNRTAGQEYGQNMGEAQFANQAQQQLFGQNLAKMQAENGAASQWTQQNQQAAQFGNQARSQGLQERAYVQNQPINQLTGLLSLGQVGMPQGVQYSPTQVGQTDVLGAHALNQQAQQNAYNAQMQNRSGLMGGLFSLGSAAIMASDGRLKTDKRLLRTRPDGVEVWAFRYLTDEPGVVRIGVMAQQVKKLRPGLVVRGADGFMAVDYATLGMLEAA